MAYNITYLNQIVADLGGSDTYIYEIDALNAICTLLGITVGHTYKIDALNAIDVNQGGSGGHKYNIEALNSIITLAGETGGYKYEPDAWAVIQQGALLNSFDELAPTDLTTTAISDVQINLAWTVNSVNAIGHRIYISTDNVTFTAHSTVALPGNSASITGLSNYTRYYFKVVAYSGDTESTAATADTTTLFYATLAATGTGAGVSTLRMEVSEDQTFEITSGTARFYTDAAGTLGESTTCAVTTGALRTIYLKAPSGSSVLYIPKPGKVTKWGNSSLDGWTSSTNAARISIEVGKLALTELRITGTSTLTGALPTGLTVLYLSGSSIAWTYTGALPIGLNFLFLIGSSIAWTYTGALPIGLNFLYLSGSSINWTYTGALPIGLTFLYLSGSSINWTGLDISGTGNITDINGFRLLNYRIAKMSSPDMVTLLTSLTNRVGSLPATVTINEYADYASPPQAVTDAVAALKIAKSITTVNLGQ